MPKATVGVDTKRVIGPIDPRIYGQYLEHVQPEDACIYGAVMDEGSPLADSDGLRRDVIDACRELQVPVVRWPGGCFADIYRWEDGVGPRTERPVRRNWHWGGLETNQFGTDEFLTWCERIEAEPYLNFNLGTGTLEEAVRWLDYCNGDKPTSDVRRRQANGREEPWNVPYWGIGNEQWGFWEAGAMDAATYAEKTRNWTQFLRKLDPSARFLGIGSPAASNPEWDLQVVQEAGSLLDYLTLHIYGYDLIDQPDDYAAVVNFPIYVEERIGRLERLIDAATAGINRAEPLRIAIDEWNVRHLVPDAESGAPVLRRLSPRVLRDALAVAGVFHAMIRHARSVAMANYVFLLNGNGVLLVGPDGVVKTPLFHVFQLYQQVLGDLALDAWVDVERSCSLVRLGRPEHVEERQVPLVDVVATVDSATGEAALAVINRHPTERAEVTVQLDEGTRPKYVDMHELTHADALAANTFAEPCVVEPRSWRGPWDGKLGVPPHSVTLARLATT